jgi:toxin ParE1/3/4
MTLAFDFHPEAQAELVADVDWYDDRESGVGGRFADAVRAAIESAVEDPAAWAICQDGSVSRSCGRRA